MEIRQGTTDDLDEMLRLFENGRAIMRAAGNMTQWADWYPQREVLEKDISNGNSYICTDGGKAVGTCCFMPGPEPTYAKIYKGKWLNDLPYHAIHRITSAQRGAGSFMLEYFFALSGNIRVDTHKDNIPMRGMLEKHRFTYCGIIFLENGDERVAYQKCDDL